MLEDGYLYKRELRWIVNNRHHEHLSEQANKNVKFKWNKANNCYTNTTIIWDRISVSSRNGRVLYDAVETSHKRTMKHWNLNKKLTIVKAEN